MVLARHTPLGPLFEQFTPSFHHTLGNRPETTKLSGEESLPLIFASI